MNYLRFKILSCWLGIVVLSLLDLCDANPIIHENLLDQDNGNDFNFDDDTEWDETEPLTEDEYRRQAFYVLKSLVKINDSCFKRVICEIAVYPKAYSTIGSDLVHMLSENVHTNDAEVFGLLDSYMYGLRRKKFASCAKKYEKCQHTYKELRNFAGLK